MAWKLEKIEGWPFGYRVRDTETGDVLLHEEMAAYSSKDQIHQDAFEARHFREGRGAAANANKAQLIKLELIVAAVNAYQAKAA